MASRPPDGFRTKVSDKSPGKSHDDFSVVGDILTSLLSLAGKGKDEAIQIVGREIGIALAAMLKEPLAMLVNNRKLKVTLEFVPNHEKSESKHQTKSDTKSTDR